MQKNLIFLRLLFFIVNLPCFESYIIMYKMCKTNQGWRTSTLMIASKVLLVTNSLQMQLEILKTQQLEWNSLQHYFYCLVRTLAFIHQCFLREKQFKISPSFHKNKSDSLTWRENIGCKDKISCILENSKCRLQHLLGDKVSVLKNVLTKTD